MSNWQPIETAPENEAVLLYCHNRGYANEGRIEFGFAKRGYDFSNGVSNKSKHAWATHWMPLPEPPEETNE